MKLRDPQADVCLILEGTYPFVTGGVSTWTHDLILAQEHLNFHLATLLPLNSNPTPRYPLPKNVTGLTRIAVQGLPQGVPFLKGFGRTCNQLEAPLTRVLSQGGLSDIAEIIAILTPLRKQLGSRLLLNSPEVWEMLLRMYRKSQPDSSFLDYFWTWRALLGGLYSMLLADLPEAKLYHAVSTGYAGFFAARAHLETGKPILLTEHGIYTNERRIEIAMADWLYELPSTGLEIIESRRNLKDLWIDTFVTYSRACYEASSQVITLYEGNQQFQVEDGAAPEKLVIIPNGIDFGKYSSVLRTMDDRPPTIALIGRVVPIKDVKTYIRACAILREAIPDLQALIMGPTDEEETYFSECREMIEHMGLQQTVTFTGRVKLEDYLGRIDVIAMTSISEAQPLVILEAGAAGVPAVATDVGACREMILGRQSESPSLGEGGIITPLSNPTATASALARLLTDREFYRQCSRAIKERVRRYYNKAELDATYQKLYEFHLSNSAPADKGDHSSWQGLALNCAS
jgi:glycosyltransferase involved in cell wall biosynthesis